MQTKAEILEYLARQGIATPQTWAGSPNELAEESWDPDLFYYCRTLDPEKITVVPCGENLNKELRASADSDRRWAIQPLYNFDLSGAALITPDETYIESLWGSPLAIFREGVVAYREGRSLSDELFQMTYAQDFQIRFAGSEPQQVPLPEQYDAIGTLTRQRIHTTLDQVRARSLFGVFEWGTTVKHSVILDWKPPIDQARTDKLRDILVQPPMPQLVADYERPVLSVVPTRSADRPVVFDHGARLSHVVTRAVESGSYEVLFRS